MRLPRRYRNGTAFRAIIGCLVSAVFGVGGMFLFCRTLVFSWWRSEHLAEAASHLSLLTGKAEDYCARTGRWPSASSSVPVPPGDHQAVIPVESGFVEIGARIHQPNYYAYHIQLTTQGIEMQVIGDLDGDGVRSVVAYRCQQHCDCGRPRFLNPDD